MIIFVIGMGNNGVLLNGFAVTEIFMHRLSTYFVSWSLSFIIWENDAHLFLWLRLGECAGRF